MARTLYVILRRQDGDAGWREDGPHQTASSADQAIRQAAQLRADNDLEPSGVYAAIPARSFKQASVQVETQTRIKLGIGEAD